MMNIVYFRAAEFVKNSIKRNNLKTRNHFIVHVQVIDVAGGGYCYSSIKSEAAEVSSSSFYLYKSGKSLKLLNTC